jgi:CheY-like chemotaxis protein
MAPRILVVDDEPTVRTVTTRALQEEGYDVVALADGVAGLEAAMQGDFDLVITNNCMPRMSGDELSARLRQLFPDLPILHIDGYLRSKMATALPGEYHLDKPFSPSTLLQAVRTLLEDRARHQLRE